MSFPAWNRCFPCCGFLTWNSKLASPERGGLTAIQTTSSPDSPDSSATPPPHLSRPHAPPQIPPLLLALEELR